MKSINKKLTLSALALACCLSAGVMSLQSTTAEDTMADTYEGFNMVNGAAVYLGNKDEFSGIRWTTKVTDELYELINSKNKGSFGVIVAPTESIETELTHNTKDVIDLSTGKDIKKVDGVYTYYSAIDFNDIVAQYEAEQGDLTEDQEAALLQQAYDMKLTARAYITTGSRYWYADMTGVDTSRSAKQVAIAAELAGEIDEDYRGENATADDTAKAEKAANYYGKTNDTHLNVSAKSNGAVGTKFVTADTAETVADYKKVSFTATGENVEVFIGIEKLSADAYTYENGTLTITDVTGLPVGETYATVLTSAVAQAEPLIIATKVLDSTDDLKMFNAKGTGATVDGVFDFKYTTRYNYAEQYWAPEQEQSGYYVLANNIEADGYKHGSRKSYDVADDAVEYNNYSWNGADKYVGYPIGLTGTFNGLGYTIKDMTIATKAEGFFGIVNGGTVKNVAFTNVKSGRLDNGSYGNRYVIANYLVGATIDNVFISTNAYNSNDKTNNPGFDIAESALLASYAIDDTKISNCRFVNAKTATGAANVKGLKGGVLFATTHSDESYTFNNVFVYNQDTSCGIHRLYVNEINEGTTLSTKDIPISACLGKLATTQTVDKTTGELSGEITKGLIYLYENQDPANAAHNATEGADFSVAAYNDEKITELYDFVYLKNVSRYRTEDEIKQGFKLGYNNTQGFETSGCWDTSAGYPVWKALQN